MFAIEFFSRYDDVMVVWRLCGSLTHVCCSMVFLSFLVFSVDHHGTFCTHLLLIVPGLPWYVLCLRFCSPSAKIRRERLSQTVIATVYA